jgi:hypothetical protein
MVTSQDVVMCNLLDSAIHYLHDPIYVKKLIHLCPSVLTVSIGPLIFRALSARGPRPRVDRKGRYLCSRPLRAFSSESGFSKLFFAVLRATTIETRLRRPFKQGFEEDRLSRAVGPEGQRDRIITIHARRCFVWPRCML